MREWRAEIRRELKDEYVAYIAATGIAAYRQTPGNLGALIAARDFPEDDRFLLTRPDMVQYYDPTAPQG